MPARILIIEDNAANLELMVYLLSACGYETVTAANGRQGLDAARSERPDVIVCDVQMPEMDGYEVAAALKSDDALRRTPLVAVTAFAMVGDRDKALAAGFDDYVPKPIEPDEIVARIESLLPPERRSRPAKAAAGDVAAAEHGRKKGRTILFVDNVRTNLELAASIFEYAGYDTILSLDAVEALELARKHRPDLIVSDVCMPAASGYDFIAAVKADPDLRDIPFVFLTSTAITDADRSRALGLGAEAYLVRPIDPERMLAEVERRFKDR